MFYLLVSVAVIAGGGLIYLAALPGRYQVRRSLSMKVDRQQVFDKLRDLRGWGEWSPWLMHERDARLAFSEGTGEGDWYSWDGQRVGAGTLTHVEFNEPSRIDQRIEFVRPFRSQASVVWELSGKDGETEVTWGMEGSLPLYLRPLRATMTQMIAKDYDLGLLLLRGTLDPQAERPRIEFVGTTEVAPRTALTIPFKGGKDAMIKAMEDGFERLVATAGRGITGQPFAAYHKVDPKAMYFECDMAVPVSEETQAGDLVRKSLGGGKYFEVELTGSYDFLDLAWHSAIAHIRMRKLAMDRSRPCLEVYENDPGTLQDTNEIRTRLYVAVR